MLHITLLTIGLLAGASAAFLGLALITAYNEHKEGKEEKEGQVEGQ